MTIKEQLEKLKQNWLIIAIVAVLLIFLSGGGNVLNQVSYSMSRMAPAMEMAYDAEEAVYAKAGGIPPIYDQGFAPEVEERKITKTTSLSTEVERGSFDNAEKKLKAIVKSSNSYLLNENVNKYGIGIKEYKTGSYQIKVDEEKYDSVITQLKDLGEINSFDENARDITASYTNVKVELEAEKSRLKRYQQMYEEADEMSDKLTLTDRIFEQERRIKYMEESLDKIDQKVDYSTIYFTLMEKRSDYADVIFIKFSEMVRGFVNSFNGLVKFLVYILPWAVVLLIARWIYRLTKRRAKKR